MTDEDDKRFAYCMAALSEAFSQEVSETKSDIYFKALSDLSIEIIEKAIWILIQTRTTATFPKVAEIRQAVMPNLEDQAIIAYDVFTKGKARTGPYDSVCFEDKTIHAVIIGMGGWEMVCMITEDEWRYRRKEFIDLYRAFSRNPANNPPEKLIGIHEHTNSQNPDWHKYIPPLVVISTHGEITERKSQLIHEEKEVPQLEGALRDEA